MSLSISALLKDPGQDIYYNPKFRTMIETHLNILKTSGITLQQVSGDLVYQYEGDFYGYLMYLGIPLHLHWIYLRVNGMEHPNQFGKEVRDKYQRAYSVSVIMPSQNIIDDLQGLFLTTKFKS